MFKFEHLGAKRNVCQVFPPHPPKRKNKKEGKIDHEKLGRLCSDFTAIVGESGHVFLTFYANIICKLDKPSEICCPAAR